MSGLVGRSASSGCDNAARVADAGVICEDSSASGMLPATLTLTSRGSDSPASATKS